MTPDNAAFVVMCDKCEMRCETSSLDEAMTFAVKHHDHTGHQVEWDSARLTDGVISLEDGTYWRVHCDECDTTRRFESKDEAEAYRREHEEYAGHPAPEPEEIDRPDLAPDDVETLVNYCFRHAESVNVVPKRVVLEALEEAGVNRRKASQKLSLVEKNADLYEPTGGYLARYGT